MKAEERTEKYEEHEVRSFRDLEENNQGVVKYALFIEYIGEYIGYNTRRGINAFVRGVKDYLFALRKKENE